MGFGSHVDMGIYQKLLVVTIAALKHCPSSLVLTQRVLDWRRQMNPAGHQIFANPDFQSKRKRRAKPFGAGYTEYQADIICVDPFGENVCVISHL